MAFHFGSDIGTISGTVRFCSGWTLNTSVLIHNSRDGHEQHSAGMILYNENTECFLQGGVLLFTWVEDTNEQSRKG
jgi:hypothetical protein